jgi:hypothetical protein
MRREVIKSGLMQQGRLQDSEMADDMAALPVGSGGKVLDYGSDSDLPATRADSLARRRSLLHLRESRRRDSITKMCASHGSAAPVLVVIFHHMHPCGSLAALRTELRNLMSSSL